MLSILQTSFEFRNHELEYGPWMHIYIRQDGTQPCSYEIMQESGIRTFTCLQAKDKSGQWCDESTKLSAVIFEISTAFYYTFPRIIFFIFWVKVQIKQGPIAEILID